MGAVAVAGPGHGPWQKKRSSMKEACVVRPDRRGEQSKGCRRGWGVEG